MGDEVQVVHLVEDEGEGADSDDEDRGAQGHRPDPAEEAHPAVAAALLAGLGEVLALEGVEHVADADHLAGQVGGDQVAQAATSRGLRFWNSQPTRRLAGPPSAPGTPLRGKS